LRVDIDAALIALFIHRQRRELQHAAFLQLVTDQLKHTLNNHLMIVIRHDAAICRVSAACITAPVLRSSYILPR
jgi:hypothetical protein